jgi:hypothetical protein
MKRPNRAQPAVGHNHWNAVGRLNSQQNSRLAGNLPISFPRPFAQSIFSRCADYKI